MIDRIRTWRRRRRNRKAREEIVRDARRRQVEAIEQGDPQLAKAAGHTADIATAAQRSAELGGAYVRAYTEPLVDASRLHPDDAALARRIREDAQARQGGFTRKPDVQPIDPEKPRPGADVLSLCCRQPAVDRDGQLVCSKCGAKVGR